MNAVDIPKDNNNKHSGGFPHSEIHGSKLILSSPWLIAEYHVLHRLLLPRHPPNALIALDLIRKKKDSIPRRGALQPCVLLRCAGVASGQKHVHSRPRKHVRGHWLVVLDLDNVVVRFPAPKNWRPPHPHSGTADNADYLSERCKMPSRRRRASDRTSKREPVALADRVDCHVPGNGGA